MSRQPKSSGQAKTMGKMQKGIAARIVRVDASNEIALRLMEMGLLEGALVELVHEAPFGGDPVAVRVRGALVALRRSEADLIEVEALP